MKHSLILTSVFLVTIAFNTLKLRDNSTAAYDPSYIEISSVKYKEDQFTVVAMKRDSNRVKVKYFAAADFNGNNVYQRYQKWVRGKNVILVSSGTYMDYNGVPVGLTIDNGVLVNKSLSNNFDGLVIVNTNGGIAVTNLKDGDLKLKGEGVDSVKKFDLRKSAWDLQVFTKWALAREATVFQTHLLVYRNHLQIAYLNASPAVAPRRFLAICEDEYGKVVHVVIQSSEYASLYNASVKAQEYLNQVKKLDITCMINLDTGDQDVFKLYDKDGNSNKTVKGEKDISVAVNLLTYYFQ